MFTWAGHTFSLIADITTGDYYRALQDIVGPQAAFGSLGDEEVSRRATDACYKFVSDVVSWKGHTIDRDVLARMQLEYNKDLEVEEYELVFPHLFNAVVAASGWGQHEVGLHAYYRLVTGSDKYDPQLGESPCECEECMGRLPRGHIDEGCLFRQSPITAFVRRLGSMSPELVNKYWDRPLYLFRHAQIESTHAGMRRASVTQDHKRKKIQQEAREGAWAHVREKYGQKVTG